MLVEMRRNTRILPNARKSESNFRRTLAAISTLLIAALAGSCGGGSGNGSSQSPGAPPAKAAIFSTTTGTLFPAFNPANTDYVYTPASGGNMQVMVTAPFGTTVSVDNAAAKPGSFVQSVSLNAGQSMSIVVTKGGVSTTYYVRQFPVGFPTWTVTRTGTPQAEYYAITPDIPITTGKIATYAIIVDGYGVPIWWYNTTVQPRNVIVLSDGNLAWMTPTGVVERTLAGALVRSFGVNSSIGGSFDDHEAQQLANGDYVIIADVVKGPVNLTAEGGLASAMVIDNVIEEIAPNGSLVWSWSAMDHISAAETYPLWWPQYIEAQSTADVYHMNSVEPNGSGYLVSFRHLSAIIQVDKATGDILWKLGGTQTAGSLAFAADTYGNFGGQHDARVLPDSTITVHDNGTLLGRGPRAVRYSINRTAGTATLLEQVTDPTIPDSLCCGSARKLSTGNWGIDWGENTVVEEMTPAGDTVFELTFNQPVFTYRALPIPTGILSPAALRAGMDAQFPR